MSSGVCLSVKTPAVHSACVIWPLEGGRGALDGTYGNYACFMCKVIIYEGVSCPLVPALPFTLVELLTAQSELRGSGQLSRAVDDMHLQCKLSS